MMNKLLPTKISLKFILAVFAIIAVFFTVTSVILPHFIKNAIYKSNKKLLSDIAERLSEMPYTSVPDLILHIETRKIQYRLSRHICRQKRRCPL